MNTVAMDSRVVRLRKLTMVPEGDEVMVGRADIGSYAVFPAEGAEILRRLDAGATLGEAAAWYERTCGSTLDVDDYLHILQDLQFTLDDGEDDDRTHAVRWQRLGRLLFAWPAWAAYAALVVAATVLMVRDSSMRPSYRNLFFTTHISLIPLALMGGTIPCILIHESFHALAGRRLGLPSRLSIGRRLVYLVAETRLDALHSVPRRARYLPFVAGMVADVVVTSALTVASDLLRQNGAPRWLWGLLLAVAFTCVLRLLWQFLFYLETDLYFVASTALGCTNLQNATRHLIASQVRRLFRRRATVPANAFSEHDHRVARWYAPILIAGYGFSLITLAWAGLPTAIRIWSLAVGRIINHRSATATIDAFAFLLIEAIPMALLGYISVRDRRARRRPVTTN